LIEGEHQTRQLNRQWRQLKEKYQRLYIKFLSKIFTIKLSKKLQGTALLFLFYFNKEI